MTKQQTVRYKAPSESGRGEWKETAGFAVNDHICVADHKGKQEERWSVTHTKTGFCVAAFKFKADAKRFAEALWRLLGRFDRTEQPGLLDLWRSRAFRQIGRKTPRAIQRWIRECRGQQKVLEFDDVAHDWEKPRDEPEDFEVKFTAVNPVTKEKHAICVQFSLIEKMTLGFAEVICSGPCECGGIEPDGQCSNFWNALCHEALGHLPA